MIALSHEFEHLFNREGFNKSLNHFQTVSELVGEMEDYNNLADILNEMLEEKTITKNQLVPILHALLVDKYKYSLGSYNLETTSSDFNAVCKETATWNAVDLVIAYHHPELGCLMINPKNPRHWESVQQLKSTELITLYAGAFDKTKDGALYTKAIETLLQLINGRSVKVSPTLKKGSYRYKQKPEPKPRVEPVAKKTTKTKQKAAARGAGPSKTAETADRKAQGKNFRITPKYSVPVTNELFHNGNVEAWKKIIESYTTKYPGVDVFIYYDNERIHDLNTLFKWGKVKHGSSIFFCVAGENIKDVAKLQRYLMQGASNRFEDFLKFPVNTILNLF